MPDYTSNLKNSVSGHTGGMDETATNKGTHGPLDDAADVRDLLSALVGAGKDGLRPDDKEAVYARLGSILGKSTAQKLITQAYLFNQRPDMLQKNPQQRISSFYDIGSNDPEINKLIQRTKMLGQGPVSAADQSVNSLTKKVSQGSDVKTVAKNKANEDQLSGGLKIASGL